MPARFSSSRLDAVERTTSGALRVPAVLTRAGVFSYTDPTGRVVREWRPEEEVHRADSLASLEDVPVTIGHPPRGWDPSLHSARHAGHVRASSVRKDEGTAGVAAQLILARPDAIEGATRRELADISAGYDVNVDPTPGVVPEGRADAGKPYDQVQRDIRYNHVALLRKGEGRLGTQCGLRLDAAGEQIPETQTMIKIGDKTYEGEAAQAAVDALQARADAATAEANTLRTEKATAARNALVAQAKPLLGASWTPTRKDAAGAEVALTEREIHCAVIAKVDPSFVAEGRADAYVAARYDLALEAHTKGQTHALPKGPSVDAARLLNGPPSPAGDRADGALPDPQRDPRGYAAALQARAANLHHV